MTASPRAMAAAVMATCFTAGFLGRGLVESFVVFVLPLGQSFGWDRATVVSIYSLSLMASGLVAPVVGRLFDRAGPRLVYLLGLFLLGGGFSLAPFATELWQFRLCLGLATGIAAACLGNVPNATLLGRWFQARITLATSVVFSALGIGILVMVPLAQLLVERIGWRAAFHWLGGATLALLLPALLLPWGGFQAGAAGIERPATAAAAVSSTLAGALRHPAFWGLSSVFMFTSIAMFSLTAQIVAYLVEIGFAPIEAATAWGFTGMLLPLGMIFVGWLDGAIGRRPSILLSYGSSLVGIVLLWALARFPSVWLLGAFVVCFGGMLGSRGPLVSTIALRVFRGPAAATIFGMISISGGIGAALGSWLGGLIHDVSGGYGAVIALSATSVLVAVLPFFAVKELRR